jgi:hypothetical protein
MFFFEFYFMHLYLVSSSSGDHRLFDFFALIYDMNIISRLKHFFKSEKIQVSILIVYAARRMTRIKHTPTKIVIQAKNYL